MTSPKELSMANLYNKFYNENLPYQGLRTAQKELELLPEGQAPKKKRRSPEERENPLGPGIPVSESKGRGEKVKRKPRYKLPEYDPSQDPGLKTTPEIDIDKINVDDPIVTPPTSKPDEWSRVHKNITDKVRGEGDLSLEEEFVWNEMPDSPQLREITIPPTPKEYDIPDLKDPKSLYEREIDHEWEM